MVTRYIKTKYKKVHTQDFGGATMIKGRGSKKKKKKKKPDSLGGGGGRYSWSSTRQDVIREKASYSAREAIRSQPLNFRHAH